MRKKRTTKIFEQSSKEVARAARDANTTIKTLLII